MEIYGLKLQILIRMCHHVPIFYMMMRPRVWPHSVTTQKTLTWDHNSRPTQIKVNSAKQI